ncbi:MAG TPA: hypothetical protein VI997_10195 [Candidatus Thermoplasmatota archaeon]|nr:hypothetical protein [Candidatus Thermoplasmatota archaeon]
MSDGCEASRALSPGTYHLRAAFRAADGAGASASGASFRIVAP